MVLLIIAKLIKFTLQVIYEGMYTFSTHCNFSGLLGQNQFHFIPTTQMERYPRQKNRHHRYYVTTDAFIICMIPKFNTPAVLAKSCLRLLQFISIYYHVL